MSRFAIWSFAMTADQATWQATWGFPPLSTHNPAAVGIGKTPTFRGGSIDPPRPTPSRKPGEKPSKMPLRWPRAPYKIARNSAPNSQHSTDQRQAKETSNSPSLWRNLKKAIKTGSRQTPSQCVNAKYNPKSISKNKIVKKKWTQKSHNQPRNINTIAEILRKTDENKHHIAGEFMHSNQKTRRRQEKSGLLNKRENERKIVRSRERKCEP